MNPCFKGVKGVGKILKIFEISVFLSNVYVGKYPDPGADDHIFCFRLGPIVKKATEAAAPLVALWKEEILPVVKAFFNDPGRS